MHTSRRAQADESGWTAEFPMETSELSAAGRKETTPLEPATKEYKYHAPGVGLVRDGSLKLVASGKVVLPGR